MIAFTFDDFETRVRLAEAPCARLRAAGEPPLEAASWEAAFERLEPGLSLHGRELLLAAVHRFALSRRAGPLPPFELEFESSIPQQVGLAGSSAIVVAALRALAQRFEVELVPAALAELALAAEVEDLGIAAGPQDRVVQAYEGLVAMDFAPPRSAARYRRLDEALLPPLFLAWDPASRASSNTVHGAPLASGARDQASLAGAIERIAAIADEGERLLREREHGALSALFEESFTLRAAIAPLKPRDGEMVELARAHAAAAKLAGSGGAVVGIASTPEVLTDLASAYRSSGFSFLLPHVTRVETRASRP